MEMLYFTVAAIFLYLASDWILNQIENRRGERFVNRSLIFFVIILVLSLALFRLVQYFQPATAPSAPVAEVPAEQGTDAPRSSLADH